MNAEDPEFLDVDDVLEIHATQLAEFGGSDGLRDRGLLQSAVAQARASFGGEYFHRGLFSMAAAYLFHIVANHPFVDGNKRTGLLAALVFLDINGIAAEVASDEYFDLTIGIANGHVDKSSATVTLERIVTTQQHSQT